MSESDEQKDKKEKQRENLKSLRESIEELSLSFEQHVEGMSVVSKCFKARYETLIDAGFTEAQAFELVKARGLS